MDVTVPHSQNKTETVDVQLFLSRFAETFNNNKAHCAADFCSLPNVIMSDHGRIVVNDYKELQSLFVNFIGGLTKYGIMEFIPIVNQTMRLSDSLFFTNIRWQFIDSSDQISFSCAASYTLQKMAGGELKIIITVIDDEDKHLQTIFPYDIQKFTKV